MDKSSHPPAYHVGQDAGPPPVIVGQPQPYATPQQVFVGPTIHYGPESQSIQCPHCRSQILTKVETETTTRTHLVAVLMCACCCWLCAWLPYCMDSCKNKNHYCPSCGAFLGAHSR
ncbi:LITAF-like zinc ribbon domain [Popillia japonica]|uniref:LITAF-like zinc ribbon domain n=1 Tax=Popillia japonica TaxID=7064 RepID=A0AAW1KI05_POPJA